MTSWLHRLACGPMRMTPVGLLWSFEQGESRSLTSLHCYDLVAVAHAECVSKEHEDHSDIF